MTLAPRWMLSSSESGWMITSAQEQTKIKNLPESPFSKGGIKGGLEKR
jgi:hypothetical protein